VRTGCAPLTQVGKSSVSSAVSQRLPGVRVIVYDAGAISSPDAATVDRLARLQLYARRMGVTIELRNARRELVDLLALLGLTEVLPVEMRGQTEQREQRGIDEEVDSRDAPL
jgi:hypothetical protein